MTAFEKIVNEILELHKKKAKDYGEIEDERTNVRASEEIGIPAWKGVWMRMRDKVKRIDKFCRDGVLANESVEDSMMDLTTYGPILIYLFREYIEKENAKTNPIAELGKQISDAFPDHSAGVVAGDGRRSHPVS